MNKRMQWTALAAVLAVPAVQAGEAKIGDTTLTWGGYVKVDALASRFSEGEVAQSTSRDFYVPGTIPVSAGGGDAHTSMSICSATTVGSPRPAAAKTRCETSHPTPCIAV